MPAAQMTLVALCNTDWSGRIAVASYANKSPTPALRSASLQGLIEINRGIL